MKVFVSTDDLRTCSYELAAKVLNDGFKPDYVIALWRGGSTIGICVHELFKYCGLVTDHIAIRTSRYTGIDKTVEEVAVHNLGYLLERLNADSKVLLVDDVFDSGLSIAAVIETLKSKLCEKCPKDIRVATAYYKPTKNKTEHVPNYFVHCTNDWIVFPHELEELTLDEIEESKGAHVALLIKNLMCHNNKH